MTNMIYGELSTVALGDGGGAAVASMSTPCSQAKRLRFVGIGADRTAKQPPVGYVCPELTG